MTLLNMKYFLKLSAKALLEAYFLVKQKQQLGAHTGKYTKKIESILQDLRKHEVSPHRVYLVTLDKSLRPQERTEFRCARPLGTSTVKLPPDHNVYRYPNLLFVISFAF